ncbi:MAG: RHS repeat-associated core domain-containing protein [Flavobacterium sp.]|nr:RHS repeat-associated core domain-containing protein [Flavobacterium sp.]MCZ8298559.1 RHS repeat-associated core domain-containing protein [Flavobacterium sp.]
MAIIERNDKCYVDTKKEPIWWYHPDHLGSSSYLSDYSGLPSHYYNYLPFGEEMVAQNTSAYDNKYRFSGKELDEETGLSYFGARYYNPKWSIWLGVDPEFAKAPNWTPYRYGFNNPIRYTDPDGRWEWDKGGNLKAQKGDNSYSLAKFLGTNQKNALTILNRSGYTVNKKGILNLKAGQQISKSNLWVGTKSSSGIVVNNTSEATDHYMNGNGQPADVGDQSTRELLSSTKFNEKHTKITTQKVQEKGNFSVDLTDDTFHIGRTNIDYKVSGNGKSSSVTYTLFSGDGFWDPDFVDEKIGSDWLGLDRYKPDGIGPNLERLGGKPYPYKTRTRTYFFKPVEEKK